MEVGEWGENRDNKGLSLRWRERMAGWAGKWLAFTVVRGLTVGGCEMVPQSRDGRRVHLALEA
jgi:hypothetical protein